MAVSKFKKELSAFAEKYHEFVAACDDLKEKRDEYAALEAMSEDAYYNACSDPTVVEAKQLLSTATAAYQNAEKNRQAVQKLLSDGKSEIEKERQKLESQNEESQKQADEQRERNEAYKYHSSIFSPVYLKRIALALIAAIAIAYISISVSSSIQGGIDKFISNHFFLGGILKFINSILRLGLLLALLAGMVYLAYVVGMLVGDWLAPVGSEFVVGVPIMVLTFTGEGYLFSLVRKTMPSDPGVISSLGIILSLAVFIWPIYTMYSSVVQRQDSKYEVEAGESALATLEYDQAVRERELEELNETEEQYTSGGEAVLAQIQEQFDEVNAFYHNEVQEQVALAKREASLLRQQELFEKSQFIETVYAYANDLYTELNEMVEASDDNLPTEPDWPLTDILLEAVNRGYAETRKEALRYCREEARHQELIKAANGIVEENQALRAQVKDLLDVVAEQKESRAASTEDELEKIHKQQKKLNKLNAQASDLQQKAAEAAQSTQERVNTAKAVKRPQLGSGIFGE